MRTLTRQDRKKIAQTALQYLDRPYALYADGQVGFNCSQFVTHIYNLVMGWVLPAKVDWLFWHSQLISINDLQKGDLVFFCAKPRPFGEIVTHVGIYLGDNQVIHASYHNQKVAIDSFHALRRRYNIIEWKDPEICHRWVDEKIILDRKRSKH